MSLRELLDSVSETLLYGVIAVAILLCYLVSCLGCATTQCPECVPTVETITIKVPVDACEPPPAIPTLEYPSWPQTPQTASEEAYKAFYADVAATLKARELILFERIDALEALLDSYR
jgi:hypothetical protein